MLIYVMIEHQASFCQVFDYLFVRGLNELSCEWVLSGDDPLKVNVLYEC